MSHNWKHIIFKTAFGILLTGVLIGAFVLGKREYRNTVCKEVKVTIEDSLHRRLVTEKSIKEYLDSEYNCLVGMPLSEIDLGKVEKLLEDHICVRESNVYVSNDGLLNVRITQRQPIVRFQTGKVGYYCDKDCHLIPARTSYVADVPVVDGNIPIDTADFNRGYPIDSTTVRWMKDMVKMAEVIDSHPIWKNTISQIHCDEKRDLVIVTKAGNEKFIFGQPEHIGSKLDKMQIYYEAIAAQENAKEYEVVDLRFKKQIVCRNNEQK